jgi:hypothetical protein
MGSSPPPIGIQRTRAPGSVSVPSPAGLP